MIMAARSSNQSDNKIGRLCIVCVHCTCTSSYWGFLTARDPSGPELETR